MCWVGVLGMVPFERHLDWVVTPRPLTPYTQLKNLHGSRATAFVLPPGPLCSPSLRSSDACSAELSAQRELERLASVFSAWFRSAGDLSRETHQLVANRHKVSPVKQRAGRLQGVLAFVAQCAHERNTA